MELPVTTPISIRPGIANANGVVDYGGMDAGFARAPRIARHRHALYTQQSLLEIKNSPDECQQNTLTEKRWPEHHTAESKSLPYISSSSTLDNTTISASISLDSHSVYSTPPPSLILHNPVITVTGPAEQDFDDDSAQEDRTDYQSNDEGKSQYESPNPIHTNAEQDDLSLFAATPNLGKLARRRGFQGLPIITSFPSSQMLLSPLSVVFPPSSSRRSPDHNSSYTSSPPFTSTTSSSFSPTRSIISASQQSSRTDLSTSCDEEDPFSTHGDSFYSTGFFGSGEDVNDLTIYTLDGKTGEKTDSLSISHHENNINSNNLGLANGHPLTTNVYDISAYISHEGLRQNGRKTRPKNLKRSQLSSQPSIDVATSDADHPCLATEVEVSLGGDCRVSDISASTISKLSVSKSVPRPPARRVQMQTHRLTMAVADGNFATFIDLTNQSEDMDVYSYKHFSFPYYSFSKGWSATIKPVSGVSPMCCSRSFENTGQTLLPRDAVPVILTESVSVNMGLCIPTPPVIPQLDIDLFRSLELSFDDFGILSGTTPANLSGSPTESSRIPVARVRSGCGPRTESMSFFDRGLEVQAWISMVNSSLFSGVSPGPANLLAAVDGVSPNGDECHAPADSFHVGFPRPKSLGSLSNPALEIGLDGRRSSVIYTCERRTLDISALRPLMLPPRLTFRDSLESIPNNWDAEKKSSIDFATVSNPNARAIFQGPYGDLLEALHLCSVADNPRDHSISSYLSTTTMHTEEPVTNNSSLDITVSCGIAL